MGGWWNMYDYNVSRACNLDAQKIVEIMKKYSKCYEIFIEN
jgi:hypothetical protein